MTDTLAVPNAFAAGVNVSVPSGATAGCAENSPLLSFETVNVTVWPDSSGGPALIAVAHVELCGPESSFTVTLPPPVKLGGSFTLVTVIVNVCGGLLSSPPLAVPPSSVSSIVIVAVPFAFGAGV